MGLALSAVAKRENAAKTRSQDGDGRGCAVSMMKGVR